MDDLETLRQRQRRSLPAGTLAEYDQRAETLMKGLARPGRQDDHDQGDF